MVCIDNLMTAMDCDANSDLYRQQSQFVKNLEKLCNDNDILLIVDEVQTGNGRTGKLYGFMNYGVLPDIFSTCLRSSESFVKRVSVLNTIGDIMG